MKTPPSSRPAEHRDPERRLRLAHRAPAVERRRQRGDAVEAADQQHHARAERAVLDAAPGRHVEHRARPAPRCSCASPSSSRPWSRPPSQRERRRRRRAAAELDVGRQLARLRLAASGCSCRGSTRSSPVIAAPRRMPEITAASTQPPSMPLLVQSPASVRLAKPESPEGSRCSTDAGGREHVALPRRDVGAPVLGVEARRAGAVVAVDERVPVEARRSPAASGQSTPRSRSTNSIAFCLHARRSACAWVSPARSSSTPQK